MRVANCQSVSRIRITIAAAAGGTRSPGVRCLRWNLKVQPRREVRSFRSSHPLHPSLLCAALPPLLVRLVLCHPPPTLSARNCWRLDLKGHSKEIRSLSPLCYSLSSSVGRSPRRDLSPRRISPPFQITKPASNWLTLFSS